LTCGRAGRYDSRCRLHPEEIAPVLDLATALKRRELVVNLAVRTLKVRYKNSALGFLWTLINPLLMMLIYAFFIMILAGHRGLGELDIRVLLVGVIFWQFVVMCTGDAGGVIAGHANLVKKVYFPRVLMPFSMCVANLVNYLLSLVVLLVLVVVISLVSSNPDVYLDPTWLWLLPLALVLQFALVLGIALIVSALNVYFRDIEHITSVVLMALFFMSPILYKADLVRDYSAGLARWYMLNPFASIVTLMRRAFLGASVEAWPVEWTFIPSLALSLVVLAFGLWLFSRLEPHFADHL
jgi:lipopolysaccharide transport system permease protein